MIVLDALGVLALGEIPLDPVGTSITALPPYGPQRPANLNVWTFGLNLNLVSVRLPAGKQVTELTPASYVPPRLDLRSWTWKYNQNLIGKDKLPAGKQRTELPAQLAAGPFGYRTWTWEYNKNLIGKDKLPVGKQVYDLAPSGPLYPIQLRSWTKSQQLSVSAPVPFNQEDWPLPQRAGQPAYGLTASFNLNLIGQDKLPTGEASNIVPIGPEYHAQLRTWTWSYNLNLIGKDQLPVGQESNVVPTGPIHSAQLRTWSNGIPPQPPVQVPFNQEDWPNPRGFAPLVQTWTQSFNLNLIGQDQLPVGERSIDLPAQSGYPISLRSSIFVPQLQPTQAAPFNQEDWPIPRAAQQPTQSWTHSFNLNLIGKDKLPFRQQDWPLAPDLFKANGRRGIDTWNKGININLFPPPAPPVLPNNQFYWPLPGRYPVPIQQASFWPNGGNFAPPFIPPVPPPTPPDPSTTQGAPGLEWQPYDRIREPGPIGWR